MLTLADRVRPDQRHAITLSYFGGYSDSEVAVPLRQPVGTIKAGSGAISRICDPFSPDDPDR